MAYLSIMRRTGDPAELMETHEKIDAAIAPILEENGVIIHIVAPTDDGTVMVNLWESKEGSDIVGSHPDVRAAVSEHAGDKGEPQWEHYDLARYETP